MAPRYLPAIMNSHFNTVLSHLKITHPAITFAQGDCFMWSPHTKTVLYNAAASYTKSDVWALIHEAAHAQLNHLDYKNDITLLRMESAAWERAKIIAASIGEIIDEEHVQDCLDTYRDWLHKRATCPSCNVVTMQRDDLSYKCFNCQDHWRVPESPLCRVTRRKVVSNIS